MSKNLIFIFADQWRRQAVGFANEDPVITPTFDELARNGVYNTNALSSCPLCSPHRASLLTGKYPLSTGVFTNCKTGLKIQLHNHEVTISDILKNAGYSTGYIGKWHLDEPELNHNGVPTEGVKRWDAYTPPGVARHGFDFWYSYGASDRHLSPHYWSNTNERVIIDDWSPTHEVNKAIEFLGDKKDKPFALMMSINPPHNPYELVPQKYLDIYKDMDIELRPNVNLSNVTAHTGETENLTPEQMKDTIKQYFAAVTGIDTEVGRLIKYLKENDLYDDTYIVISADHGDMMASHQMIAKHVWYEESQGIPFIITGPKLSPGICEKVFGSADVMPTLLELLDLEIPKTVEGVSVAQDFIKHTKTCDNYSVTMAFPGKNEYLDAFRLANKDPRDFGWRCLRTQKYSYVVELGYEPNYKKDRYLYDLQSDPYQMNPLNVEDHKDMVTDFDSKLIKFMESQNDGFRKYFYEV